MQKETAMFSTADMSYTAGNVIVRTPMTLASVPMNAKKAVYSAYPQNGSIIPAIATQKTAQPPQAYPHLTLGSQLKCRLSASPCSTPSTATPEPSPRLGLDQVLLPPSMGDASFEVSDFRPAGYSPVCPDLNQQILRRQVLSALGLPQSSKLVRAKGFCGGLNAGIWFLSGEGGEFVLKLVKFDPMAPAQLVEEKQFAKLYKEFPDIVDDDGLAFPCRVLRIFGASNVRHHDLIVMRKVQGKTLETIIYEKWRSSQLPDLMAIFEKVGKNMAAFHRRYGGKQHCDAGPQNMIYDEEEDHFTLIDVGGMGNRCSQTDIERFCKVLTRLSGTRRYGPELAAGIKHFEKGYFGDAAPALGGA